MALARWYGDCVVRLRWVIVAGWLAIAVVLSVFLPTLHEAGGTGGFRGLAEPDNPAVQAEIRSFREFGFPVITRTAVVQRDPDGLSAGTQLRAVADAIDFNLDPDRPPELRGIEFALPIVNTLDLLPTRERATTAITYLFFRPEVSFGRQTGLAHRYAHHYAGEPRDHLVGETGLIPSRIAQLVILRETLDRVEIATVALIFLIVALNFLALGAPLVTMVTAGVALSVIVRVSGWAGEVFGFDVPREIEPIIVALLLGIVTDYSIFFLSGMRERLAAGDDRFDAARRSTTEFAPIVLVAGLTVAAGSLALLVARVGAFRTFGPGMALTIVIGLLVAVTLVPACLAIFGKAVFWPRPPSPSSRTRDGRRSRLAVAVTGRRGALLAVVLAGGALVVASAPLRDLNLGFAVTESLPANYEAKRAADAASAGFFPGILSPTVLLVEGRGIADRRPELASLQAMLADRPGVAGVAGPADQPTEVSLGAVLSTSGNAARYVVMFSDNPLGADAIDELHALREEMPALLSRAGIPDARTSFAGDTALAEATVTDTEGDLVRIVMVATGLGFLLLVLFLRAIVAPLYLMAVNVLAVTASLGLTTFVFQGIAGQSGITFYVPFAAAVLLIALGADYSIFGVGYIWAEARSRPLTDAIRIAVPRSTRAITAAGATLALSFALLSVVPLTPFREFAFAMAVGIVIDVVVVRSLLVPSLVRLVGPASGWPGRALHRGRDERQTVSALRTRGGGPAPRDSRAGRKRTGVRAATTGKRSAARGVDGRRARTVGLLLLLFAAATVARAILGSRRRAARVLAPGRDGVRAVPSPRAAPGPAPGEAPEQPTRRRRRRGRRTLRSG